MLRDECISSLPPTSKRPGQRRAPVSGAATIVVPAAWKIHATREGMLAAPEDGRSPVALIRCTLAQLVGLSDSSSHVVTKRHHAALIAFDLRKMKGDISVELLEEAGPITDQDWQDRITNFVGQPEAKTFATN